MHWVNLNVWPYEPEFRPMQNEYFVCKHNFYFRKYFSSKHYNENWYDSPNWQFRCTVSSSIIIKTSNAYFNLTVFLPCYRYTSLELYCCPFHIHIT